MVERVNTVFGIRDLDPGSFVSDSYDLGIWTAGYEARASWWINSPYRPKAVDRWFRVEFLEDREVHSAPKNLSMRIGSLVGGAPGRRDWDGYWTLAWRRLLQKEFRRTKHRLRMVIDYSSMPRTVYGPLIIEAMGASSDLIASMTLVYVPGIHGSDVDGSRTLTGLRALIGTEGTTKGDRLPAFVLGLGYDGVLAETILEMFQIASFSCLMGNPGVEPSSVQRALSVNSRTISRADLVAGAAAWSCSEGKTAFERLAAWYPGGDIVLVPLGPKPHVVGALLASLSNRRLGFRFPQTGSVRAVEVYAAPGAVPWAARFIPQVGREGAGVPQ